MPILICLLLHYRCATTHYGWVDWSRTNNRKSPSLFSFCCASISLFNLILSVVDFFRLTVEFFCLLCDYFDNNRLCGFEPKYTSFNLCCASICFKCSCIGVSLYAFILSHIFVNVKQFRKIS